MHYGLTGRWFVRWVLRASGSTSGWLCWKPPVPRPFSLALCSKVSKSSRCPSFPPISSCESLTGIPTLFHKLLCLLGCVRMCWEGKVVGLGGTADLPSPLRSLPLLWCSLTFSNSGFMFLFGVLHILPSSSFPFNMPESGLIAVRSLAPTGISGSWKCVTIPSNLQPHTLLSYLWLLRNKVKDCQLFQVFQQLISVRVIY